MRIPLFIPVSCLLFAAACSSDSKTGKNGNPATGNDAGKDSGGGGTDALCPVVVKDADCDKTRRPFVFVHGTYGSGDNFAHVAALMASNGYCADRIVAVEYDSLGDFPGNACTDAGAKQGCGKIDAVINKVLADNPTFTQVDLAGHSQGTAHCGTYLSDPANAKKVAHYINFSGSPNVGAVQTLSLSSMHDLGNTTHHAIGTNVTEFTLQDEDHFAVAASTRSFVQVYKYLVGNDPQYQEVQCGEDPVTIEGLSETFGDNVPVTGKLEIRELGTASPRSEGTQVPVDSSDPTGHFGPVQLKRNVPYEFKGYDSTGKLIGYQYFTPFKRSNRLVRLLTPSNNTLIAAASTDNIVRGPNHVALVARWAGGAFRQDLGASLKIDGNEVLTADNAGTPAIATTNGVVGLFMYDANQNMKSDLGLVASGPFIAFTDVFMDARTPELMKVDFVAGSEDAKVIESVQIPNWPSSDAEVLVMFQ
jgi:hypothetical protein